MALSLVWFVRQEVARGRWKVMTTRHLPLPNASLADEDASFLASAARRFRAPGFRVEVSARLCQLTQRDREVLTHVPRGQLDKRIAADLGMDEHSAKRHRSSVMGKLKVQSVAQVAQLAVAAGMAKGAGRGLRVQ